MPRSSPEMGDLGASASHQDPGSQTSVGNSSTLVKVT